MLGSGSAGNSALVATDHCKILVDGGLSARQLVLRLAQCGVAPDQLDGVLFTHEHGDHVCGLEVLCRKFDVPICCFEVFTRITSHFPLKVSSHDPAFVGRL
jgi:phosphoribosyl 1,2-cyclic phosphodiesterase